MHILTRGSRQPPVVIVPALASNVLEWVRIQRKVSGEAMVCVYDRAGVGWSEPPRGRLSFDSMADDLHALLRAAGIKPPYILAGHSLGGVIARRFQARYPGEVAGLLLLDSSHENQVNRLPHGRFGLQSNTMQAARRRARILGARRLAARFGMVNSVSSASLARETVPEHAGAARMIALSSRQRRISVQELFLLGRLQGGGRPASLRSLPLTVVTAASPDRRNWPGWQTWSVMQDELAKLSADSVHFAVVNAGHNVHLDRPEIVAEAIRELVRRFRQRHLEESAADTTS
jgi:pimeloyl-ACP methyl ester carboxylesterase